MIDTTLSLRTDKSDINRDLYDTLTQSPSNLREARGHSPVSGQHKQLNDLTDLLTKNPPIQEVLTLTHPRAVHCSSDLPQPPDDTISVEPVLSCKDIIKLQSLDPAIKKMIHYLTDPDQVTPSSEELDSIPELRIIKV